MQLKFIHLATYMYTNETAKLVLGIFTARAYACSENIYIVIPSFMSACYIRVLKLNLAR